MKKGLLLLSVLLMITGASFTLAYRLNVEYDGMYVYKLDEESSAVIRFYNDGVVIVSSSTNDYSKVMTWFNREPENFSRILSGKYKIGKKDASIRFNVSGETGEQKYTGFIHDDNTLTLHIFNPKDKTSTDRTYTFVKAEQK